MYHSHIFEALFVCCLWCEQMSYPTHLSCLFVRVFAYMYAMNIFLRRCPVRTSVAEDTFNGFIIGGVPLAPLKVVCG